jgi:hypothetical protein
MPSHTHTLIEGALAKGFKASYDRQNNNNQGCDLLLVYALARPVGCKVRLIGGLNEHQSLARWMQKVAPRSGEMKMTSVSCKPGSLSAVWAFTCACAVSLQVQLPTFTQPTKHYPKPTWLPRACKPITPNLHA